MAYFCDTCQVALLAEPKLLPGYQVVKELGRGSMGAVYLAVHPVMGRRAIKMVLPHAATSQKVRDMFLREAATQAMLDHPRIVRVHDFQEAAKGIFCMVMEFVEGDSADKLVEAQPAGIDSLLAVRRIDRGRRVDELRTFGRRRHAGHRADVDLLAALVCSATAAAVNVWRAGGVGRTGGGSGLGSGVSS